MQNSTCLNWVRVLLNLEISFPANQIICMLKCVEWNRKWDRLYMWINAYRHWCLSCQHKYKTTPTKRKPDYRLMNTFNLCGCVHSSASLISLFLHWGACCTVNLRWSTLKHLKEPFPVQNMKKASHLTLAKQDNERLLLSSFPSSLGYFKHRRGPKSFKLLALTW